MRLLMYIFGKNWLNSKIMILKWTLKIYVYDNYITLIYAHCTCIANDFRVYLSYPSGSQVWWWSLERRWWWQFHHHLWKVTWPFQQQRFETFLNWKFLVKFVPPHYYRHPWFYNRINNNLRICHRGKVDFVATFGVNNTKLHILV